jgi:hypothetical protein
VAGYAAGSSGSESGFQQFFFCERRNPIADEYFPPSIPGDRRHPVSIKGWLFRQADIQQHSGIKRPFRSIIFLEMITEPEKKKKNQ